jgi:FAD/FMN-containing dehydrogenase
LGELDQALDKFNLSLPFGPVSRMFTVVGCLSTGSHGTGPFPPMPDRVRHVNILTGKGEWVRSFCPKEKDAKYPFAFLDDAAIIEDTDPELFFALISSLGACGVIHSVVLEVN